MTDKEMDNKAIPLSEIPLDQLNAMAILGLLNQQHEKGHMDICLKGYRLEYLKRIPEGTRVRMNE